MSEEMEDFLRAIWRDCSEARLRPVGEYIERFPGIEERDVREEHAAAAADESDEADGGDPTVTASQDPLRAEAQRSAREAQAELPNSVGRYVQIRPLVTGGMGVLYSAFDPELGRQVVLKTVRDPSPQRFSRLEREARILGRLDDDHLCPVLDIVRQDDGRLFVVMPQIRGRNLAACIDEACESKRREGAPSKIWPRASGHEDAAHTGSFGELPKLLAALEKVARAVHVAHEAGVIHRDLKPDNIMIQEDGEPCVLDFGLALEEETRSSDRLSTENAAPGTPPYMAPEQIHGESECDVRTDVYALGVILYECMTLELPFRGATARQIMARVVRGHPRAPRQLVKAIPRDLECVCLQAMELDPKARYTSAEAFAEELRRVRQLEPVRARRVFVPRRLRSFARRRWRELALVAITVAVTLMSFAWWRAAQREQLLTTLRAVSSGRTMTRVERDFLERRFPDRERRKRILELAQSERFLRALEDATRSGASERDMLSPRGKLCGDRVQGLEFRYRIPPLRMPCSVEVVVRALASGQLVAKRVREHAAGKGEVSALRFDEPFAPGAYLWRAKIIEPRSLRRAAWPREREGAVFRIVADPELEELRRRVVPTGLEAFDRWQRAVACVEAGFMRRAARAIDGVDERDFPGVAAWRGLRAMLADHGD